MCLASVCRFPVRVLFFSSLIVVASFTGGCAPPKGQAGGDPSTPPKATIEPGTAIPKLRYGVQTGNEFGYEMKIEAKWKDYTETYSGYLLYKVVSADADKFELKFWGRLDAKIDAHGAPAVTPFPIEPDHVMGLGPRTITIDRLGNWVDSYSLTALPYVLGDLETQVFEPLPEQPDSTWEVENSISVEESGGLAGMRSFGHRGQQRDGFEKLMYAFADLELHSARITKKYILDTDGAQASGVDQVTLNGGGEFTFDKLRGLMESLEMNYVFTSTSDVSGKKESANVNVTLKKLSAEKLAAELKPRQLADSEAEELSQQQYEDSQHPELRDISGNERILAKLAMTDESAIEETLGDLAKTPTEKRSPEVAKAIAKHLKSRSVTTQQYAAQALIHWGTVDVEADLIEATKSPEFWVAKYSRDALSKIRGGSGVSASTASTSSSDSGRTASSAKPPPVEFRKWRDASGEFEVEAQYLGIQEQNVLLKRKDGQIMSVARDKLSTADQEYINRRDPAVAQSGSAASNPASSTAADSRSADARSTSSRPADSKSTASRSTNAGSANTSNAGSTNSGAPAAGRANAGSAKASSKPALDRPVDLLTRVNPERDQVHGAWTMKDGVLVSPQGQADTLVIDNEVPESYTLTVVAERVGGTDSFNIGLVVGGRQTMLALEGWGAKANGLNTVGGRTADNNETTIRAPVFTSGRATTIVCDVTPSSVEVSCDGKTIIDWTGDAQELDLDRRFWTNLPADRLFLGTWLTSVRITKLELAPLSK